VSNDERASIAFVVFGLIAVALIGYAMFGPLPGDDHKSMAWVQSENADISVRTLLPLRGVDVDVEFIAREDIFKGTVCRFWGKSLTVSCNKRTSE
jgi:hypothetical protein